MKTAKVILFVGLSLLGHVTNARSDLGGICKVRFSDTNLKYFETGLGNQRCDDNLVCITEEDDGVNQAEYTGGCELETCYGSLTGSGNVVDTNVKVTICHRTCSETNPWVRITINENAFGDETCKHGQHSVDNCTGKNATKWGVHQSDYILKQHGTKVEVAASFGGANGLITDYWRHWEGACPSVRNGECCQYDGEYGYSCCPGGEDPTPESFTVPPGSTPAPVTPESINPPSGPVPAPTPAPVQAPLNAPPTFAPQADTGPTVAPVGAPTLAPVQAPSNAPPTVAPQAAPGLTVAPVTQLAPTNAPRDTNTEECIQRRRQLATLEEMWNITDTPAFQYSALTFTLDFEISDAIVTPGQVQYTLYDVTCTTPYTGLGLSGSLQSLYDGGAADDGKQNAPIAVLIDPTTISQDTQVYTEDASGQEVTAGVDFCLRFSLHTPPPGDDLEVNYLEVVVLLDVDLTDGFQITNMTVAPFDVCAVTANDSFEIEGYICKDGFEDQPLVSIPVVNQGQLLKICVRPVEEARDLMIRMRNIQSFTFTGINGLEQQAIVNYNAAPNGLAEVWCEAGYAICHFETILNAAFFAEPGIVSGYGVADLQFGGEPSAASVTPKQQRRMMMMRRGVSKVPAIRRLQATQPAGGGVQFGMEFNAQPVSSEYSSSSPTIKLGCWAILSVTALLAATQL